MRQRLAPWDSYCLIIPRQDIAGTSNRELLPGTVKKASMETLFSSVQGLQKGWPKDKQPLQQYLPCCSQRSILSFLSLKIQIGLLKPVGKSQTFHCGIESTSQSQINLLFLSLPPTL